MTTAAETLKARPIVLLVEDDEVLRRMLSRALKAGGFGVLEAENGKVALHVLGGLSGPPGLVLTDITMPVMGGIELAGILRSRYPLVPVLFMSGAVPPGPDGTSLLDLGAGLLLKPFAFDALLEAMGAITSLD